MCEMSFGSPGAPRVWFMRRPSFPFSDYHMVNEGTGSCPHRSHVRWLVPDIFWGLPKPDVLQSWESTTALLFRSLPSDLQRPHPGQPGALPPSAGWAGCAEDTLPT